MAPTRPFVLLLATASALAFQARADAAPCDADNYSKVATAVQTLHTNCASWAAYLANGGVWTCDSKCHDAVVNLVDTLPDCTFGGPYGQNYKEVVENMMESCGGKETSTSESTTAASSATTETSSATTAAPTSTNDSNNSTETATTNAPTTTTKSESPTTGNDDDVKTDTRTSASANASAGDAGTPASDVSTTSGANAQTVTSVTAMLLVAAVALLQ